MDYRLTKIYESILKGEVAQIKPSSLSDLYEATKKQPITAPSKQTQNSSNLPTSNIAPRPAATSVRSNIKGLSDEYNKLIASTLKTTIDQIPLPVDNYELGQSIVISNKEDFEIFSKLFSLAPSTKTSEAGDSKGSGKGEIALYWLLSKEHQVFDARDRDEPDLKIGNIGIEVKSYPGKGFKLGKFKSQINNRKLLSTVFGLKALFSLTEPKRPATVDAFNSAELISAFTEIKNLSIALDAALNTHSSLIQLGPINVLVNQLKEIENQLGIGSLPTINEEEAASTVLKKLLFSKLKTKPGFSGFYVNVTLKGQIDYYKVDDSKLKDLSPEIINKNTSSTSGELQINNAEAIFNKT
jgi:hypothetical protein